MEEIRNNYEQNKEVMFHNLEEDTSETTINRNEFGIEACDKRLLGVKRLRNEIEKNTSETKHLKVHAKHLSHELVQVSCTGDCLNMNNYAGKAYSTWIRVDDHKAEKIDRCWIELRSH